MAAGSNASARAAQASLPEITDVARQGEPDRYVAALYAPRAQQPALTALAAFVAEVRRIPASVSDPMIGEIRLQWWRDAIADGHRGVATGHPVADAAAQVVREHDLPLDALHRFVDAAGFAITGDLHADVAALDAHLAAAEGIPFALAWQILTGQRLGAGVAALSGQAYGIARDLGRVPALLHNGGFPIPAAALEAQGVQPGSLSTRPIAPETAARLEAAARELEGHARTALREARRTLATENPEGLPAILPIAMVEPYFAAQKRRTFRRLEHVIEVLPMSRFWHMGLARLRGRA